MEQRRQTMEEKVSNATVLGKIRVVSATVTDKNALSRKILGKESRS